MPVAYTHILHSCRIYEGRGTIKAYAFMRNMICVSAIRVGWLATVGAVLFACTREESSAPAGQISMSYDGASESTAFFVLENRTAHAIYFRGTHTFWSGTEPWDTAMECVAAKSAVSEETPFALMDGDRPAQSIEVSPGERMRLRVDGINGAFAAHHRGGLCHLQLRLQTGATIDSKKFEP
jgi:hypothetical protein